MKTRVRNNQHPFIKVAWLVFLSLLLGACLLFTPQTATKVATEPPVSVPTEAPSTQPPAVPASETPMLQPPLSGLSADPQRVEFQAEDGKNLVGYYYPSKYADAPIVILMHWAGGDLCDWSEIAPWLQNRQDENPAKLERCKAETRGAPYGDSTWFPPMNPKNSLAVFAFDFRGYGESEAGGSWRNYTKDARAAFVTAAGLVGVDKTRMAAIGASIGADGAADGCLLYNQSMDGGCVGALSLSPGSYLGMAYASVVDDLAPNPAWCLVADQDGEAFPTCQSASGDNYISQIYAGNAHGMMLITPEMDPQPLILIQSFLELVFGEVVK